ncbi:hypothetical protein QE438_002062 [Pseudoxanthomonas sp. SORGH_AS 997]|nr:hypothetical protein [Pseudoxanthomonas sp. SORGH_AS_0997]
MRTPLPARLCDGPGRAGRLEQRRQLHRIGVGEAGPVAADRAQADALGTAVARLLDDAILERPGLAARLLEIEVGLIGGRRQQTREDPIQPVQGQAGRCQQALLGLGDQRRHGDSRLACKAVAPMPDGAKRATA